jgi:hypothetical protein
MTVAPIQFAPLPTAYSSFDFSPLAKLGEQMAPKNDGLAGLGQRAAPADPSAPAPPNAGAVPYVTPSGAPSANAGGGSNVQSWYDFARRPLDQGGLGLTHEQAVGKVANLQAESGAGIPAWGPTGDANTAWGAAQWRGDRLTGLQKFAADRGLDYRTTEAQQAFMRDEYLGPERAAYTALTSARTPQEAATAVNRYYERSADTSGRRERNAALLATQLGSGNQ